MSVRGLRKKKRGVRAKLAWQKDPSKVIGTHVRARAHARPSAFQWSDYMLPGIYHPARDGKLQAALVADASARNKGTLHRPLWRPRSVELGHTWQRRMRRWL